MIIGHLDRDDLKNCRLVDNCTGLQATCRLFRAIHIWPATRSGEVAGKVNNPKLSGFVRCLEWHWNPLVCRCHFIYLCCMYNGIDYFKSFGHPYMRDLLQSLSRPNALCYTNGRIEKSDGACNLHGSLPQGGGLRAPPPRSRVERLLNTILVNLSVTETAGSPYVAHVEFVPMTWDTFCTYIMPRRNQPCVKRANSRSSSRRETAITALPSFSMPQKSTVAGMSPDYFKLWEDCRSYYLR